MINVPGQESSRDEITELGNRSLLMLPNCFVRTILASVAEAEALLGRPPNSVEVFVTLRLKMGGDIIPDWCVLPSHIWHCTALLTNLLRDDKLYVDKALSYWSLIKHPGFANYSERFVQTFRGYTIEPRSQTICCKPGGIAPANLKNVRLWLLAQDTEEMYKKLASDHYIPIGRILDGDKIECKVAFNSYPRSGNSMLRKMLEKMTGIVTGMYY